LWIALREPRVVGDEQRYLVEGIDFISVSGVGKCVDEFEQLMAGV
jgi:hypothetical protein